jgi:Na+-transporting methylmalonyl-CoA/oxaloacetate decarboxylase beta subunit
MTKRILAVIGIIITVLVFSWIVVTMATPDVSIGVVGGADGPTNIYLASSRVNWFEIGLLVGAAGVIIHFIRKNNKEKKENQKKD